MQPTTPSPEAPLILVVDDERDIRELLGEFLSSQGYRVASVETGREALDAVSQRDAAFQAALVDWTLPGIDGSDVVSQIHELQPDCRIFAITGHADTVVAASAAGQHVLEVFHKPFSLRQLAASLRRHLLAD